MKKLLSMLAALMLLLCCTAFAEGAEGVDYTGTWKLTGAESAGKALDIAALGIDMSMTLAEDGTCVLDSKGATQNGTWAATDTGITTTEADGVVTAYTMTDGQLVAEADGSKLIFSRAGDMAAYVDTWVLTSIEASGASVDPAVLGMTMTMALNADGTCVLSTNGVEEAGTWAATALGVAITDATDTIEFVYEGGQLVAEQDGGKMLMTRESEVAVAEEEYAMPLSGLTVSDFNGGWVFTYMEYMGMLVDPETVGTNMTLILADGVGHLEMVDAEGTSAFDALCEVEEVEGLGSVMYFLFTDANGEPDGSYLVLILYDNGELVWYTIDEEENDIFYCFQRVVEGEIPAEEVPAE